MRLKSMESPLLEYLVAQLPIRLIPSVAELTVASKSEILRVGALLGVQPTLDEWEEDRLTEMPGHVRTEVDRLKPFRFYGRLLVSSDAIDRVIRLFSHVEVFVQRFTLNGTLFTIEGYHSPDIVTYLSGNLQTILQAVQEVPPDQVIPQYTALVKVDQLLEPMVTNFQDAVWMASQSSLAPKVAVTRDNDHLYFRTQTVASTSQITDYLQQRQDYHRVLTFKVVPGQEVRFLSDRIKRQIAQLHPDVARTFWTLLLDPLTPEWYSIKYRLGPDGREHFDLFDLIITRTVAPLLDGRKTLRVLQIHSVPQVEAEAADVASDQAVIPPPLVQLTQMFTELESLTVVGGLVAPDEETMQRLYARLQGYSGGEILQHVQSRYLEFLSTGTIQRTITHLLEPDFRRTVLHFFWKRFQKCHPRPVVTVFGDRITLAGEIPSLVDALAFSALLLLAQSHAHIADSGVLESLHQLDEFEGGLRPSELLAALDVDLSDVTIPEISIVAQGNDRYTVIRIPRSQVPSVRALRQVLAQKDTLADVVILDYHEDGIRRHEYSIYTKWQVTTEELLQRLSLEPFTFPQGLVERKLEEGPDYVSPYQLRVQVASEDYKLDVAASGKYYRLDVVAIADDKPIDRFTLCWIPINLTIETPLLLDHLHQAWRHGKLLTPTALTLYRLTRKLWVVNSIDPLLTGLVPEFWDRCSQQQVRTLVKRLTVRA